MVNFNLFLLALLIISCGGGGGGGSDETTSDNPTTETPTQEPSTETPSEGTDTIPTTPWLVQLGASTAPNSGSGMDACSSIATDSSGNVYCSGQTTGALGEVNAGGADTFVMKVDASGKLEWLTHLGANTGSGSRTGNDACSDIAIDSSGNVYCGGATSGDLAETVTGSQDAFLTKLNSKGEFQWFRQLGSTTSPSGDSDSCSGIAVSSSGNIYCGGTTDGTLGASNAGGNDVFVAKFNSDGTHQWTSQHGSSGNDSCKRIALDSQENVYCAGTTNGVVTGFNAGGDDLLIVKFDSSGTFQSAIQEGSSATDECNDIVIDSNNNIICSGYTDGNLGETNSGTNSNDTFIAKYDSNGVKSWITQLGSTTGSGDNTGDDKCVAVALSGSGDIYCGGETNSALTGTYGGGTKDAFLLKVNASGSLQSIVQFNSDQGNVSQQEILLDMTIDTAGNVLSAGYTDGSFGETNAGSFDAFVLKYAPF